MTLLDRSARSALGRLTNQGDDMLERTWDIGDPEPDGVGSVNDHTHGENDQDDCSWGRTSHGEWKSYKDGGKVYLSWAELVRRWGPVAEVPR